MNIDWTERPCNWQEPHPPHMWGTEHETTSGRFTYITKTIHRCDGRLSPTGDDT